MFNKKLIKSSGIGFLIALAVSFGLTLGYFLLVESNQFLKELIQSSGFYYQSFILMFAVSVVVLGILGIIIGGVVGYFRGKKKWSLNTTQIGV